MLRRFFGILKLLQPGCRVFIWLLYRLLSSGAKVLREDFSAACCFFTKADVKQCDRPGGGTVNCVDDNKRKSAYSGVDEHGAKPGFATCNLPGQSTVTGDGGSFDEMRPFCFELSQHQFGVSTVIPINSVGDKQGILAAREQAEDGMLDCGLQADTEDNKLVGSQFG